MTTSTTAHIELFAELARLGIVIWREGGRLRVRMPPGSSWPELRARIESNEPELLSACRESDVADELLYPLCSNPDVDRYLICVHPVHGNIFDYRHLAAAISGTHAVFGFQALHWLDTKSIPTLKEMAARYAKRLIERGITGPRVVLYGASAGGAIALEMARCLAESGHEPALVVLADTLDAVTTDSAAALALRDRFLWVGVLEIYAPPELLDVAPSKHPFWSMDRQSRIAYIIERMRASPNGRCRMPPDAQLLEEHLDTYDAYFRRYADQPMRPYHGRSLYITCSKVGVERAAVTRAMLCGPTRLASIRGSHVACLRPAAAPDIAKLICEESMGAAAPCL